MAKRITFKTLKQINNNRYKLYLSTYVSAKKGPILITFNKKNTSRP